MTLLLMNLYGIIGNPIQHSLSPRIHHLFAEQLQHSLQYEAILVPVNHLAGVLADFRARGGKGLNVTLPFKQIIFDFVDIYSDRARIARAINTLIFHPDGSIFGDNTDGVGLIRDIAHHQLDLQAKQILILGAGGAVSGVLSPILQQHPAQVILANRTESKAAALAHYFSQWGDVQAVPFSELTHCKFDVIINGTSASLQNTTLTLPDNILKKNALCYDMMYGKQATAFLEWGKKNGATHCLDGLGMLIEQAAESFFLWRHERPDTRTTLLSLQPL